MYNFFNTFLSVYTQ